MSGDRAPAGDFGTKLRAARERRGISLRQIANATKISTAVLDALEHDDISRLPGGIFSRAFVRAYATEVGLDPETTIQDFVAAFPEDSVAAGHAAADRIEDNEALESDRRVASTLLWILVISVSLAGAVVYFEASGRFERRRADTPVGGARAVAIVPATPSPIGAAAPAAPVAPAVASPAAAEAAPATAAADDHLTVGLSARRPVFVSATVDGRTIERLLKAGERQTIEVRREIVLTAGDAAAISMTLNGAEARALGKAGDVVTARLNLTNFKDYLQNR
jgi:cytoskeleton protein RodZ